MSIQMHQDLQAWRRRRGAKSLRQAGASG